MLVLGIDPGTSPCGWALLDISGRARCILELRTVLTKPNDGNLVQRIETILSTLPDADLVVIENQHRAYHGKQERKHTNANALYASYVQWSVVGHCVALSVPVVLVEPQQAKVALTGRSTASKRDIGDVVSRMVGCPKRMSQHAADAVAIAVAGEAQYRRTRKISSLVVRQSQKVHGES